MITDGKKWYYLAVKKLSTLLRGIKSKHNGDLYCLNCFHSYSTEKKHEKVCKSHDYCCVLKYNFGEKLMKVPFVIYAELEC